MTIPKTELQWAGHAWRNQNPLLRTVVEKNQQGKYPLEDQE